MDFLTTCYNYLLIVANSFVILYKLRFKEFQEIEFKLRKGFF